MTSVHSGLGPVDARAASDPGPVSLMERIRYLEWSAVVAGAIVAAALALVLHAFAVAVGLSVSSTAPTWRDTSFALLLLFFCCRDCTWSLRRWRLLGSAATSWASCVRD